MDPLRAKTNAKQILTMEEIGIIFSNLDFIHSVNSQLYSKLSDRMANWSPSSTLGDIFVQMVSLKKNDKLSISILKKTKKGFIVPIYVFSIYQQL